MRWTMLISIHIYYTMINVNTAIYIMLYDARNANAQNNRVIHFQSKRAIVLLYHPWNNNMTSKRAQIWPWPTFILKGMYVFESFPYSKSFKHKQILYHQRPGPIVILRKWIRSVWLQWKEVFRTIFHVHPSKSIIETYCLEHKLDFHTQFFCMPHSKPSKNKDM